MVVVKGANGGNIFEFCEAETVGGLVLGGWGR